MIYRLLAVLIATSSGSLHCGAMCGGISLAAGAGWRSQSWYQGARLFSYLVLGTATGWFGSAVSMPGSAETVAVAAGTLLSGWLVLSGVHLFWKGRPLEPGGGLRFPWGWLRLPALARRSEWVRASAFGLLTPLLPCGWLLTAGVLSMSSGSAGSGALIFFAVWAGSLPVLLAGPSFVRAGVSLLQARGRKMVAVLMVLAGFFSIYQRLQPGPALGRSEASGWICR